jgi:chemotaxis protein CheX
MREEQPAGSVNALQQTVASVFQAMVGLDVTPLEDEVWSAGADRVAAAVHLAGSWMGALVLESSCRQACQLAGHYLSMEPPEAVDDDVRDVLGELVNMIGGNLKSALCPGASLSMPTVIDGSHYNLRIGNGAIEERQAFLCGDEVFWVFRIAEAIKNDSKQQPRSRTPA